MRMRWFFVTVLLVACSARAQSTGGSFGGGSFGGGSSGSSSSGSSGGSSGNGRGSGSLFGEKKEKSTRQRSPAVKREPTAEERLLDSMERARREQERAEWEAREQQWLASHRQAGVVVLEPDERAAFEPPGPLQRFFWPHGLLALLVFVGFVALPSRLLVPGPAKSSSASWSLRLPSFSELFGVAHIVRVSVAFDWGARAVVQKELANIAESFRYASLQDSLDQVIYALERSLPHARYACWTGESLRLGRAQARFLELASELRGRYSKELVRGERREEGDGERARSREGQGLVVVSLLMGRKGLPSSLPSEVSAQALLELLQAQTSGEPVDVLEIIWSPAAEEDRMSSAELEAHYPELVRLEAKAGALGRVSCPSCQALYAAELGACPSCGSTAPGVDAKHVLAGPCPHCQADMPRYETKCERCGAWVPADGRKA
ncbi:MAG TPA: DUF1517 domain-containing protein [Archangium sp.]|uniref:DUF1517 domain-containing protein n=1 Tax=Archangium sp. TaxID=1872627 RepID=UPI002E307859|nr:DUF1517 domain-containing protein [Archangium sp.]HEX5752740.1 DUF1517 domain-containing protein [Archangium sp.]